MSGVESSKRPTRDLRWLDVGGLDEGPRDWWLVYTLKASGLRVAVRRPESRRLQGEHLWSAKGLEWSGRERPEDVHVWVERMPQRHGLTRAKQSEWRAKVFGLARTLWAAGMGKGSVAVALGVSRHMVEMAARGTGAKRDWGVQKTGTRVGRVLRTYVRNGMTREEMWADERKKFMV